MSFPAWLPPFFEMKQWESYLVDIVKSFEEDWHNNPPTFNNLPVIYDKSKNALGVPNGVWKVISQSSPNTNGRILDFIRGERILWIRCIIEVYSQGNQYVHHYSQKTKNSKGRDVKRDILFLDIEDYCHEIILQKRGNYYYLVSSFHIREECKKWAMYSQRSIHKNRLTPLKKGRLSELL